MIFHDSIQHGKARLPVNKPLAFEDTKLEGYFIRNGWAEATDKAAKVTITNAMIKTDGYDEDPPDAHARPRG